MSTRVSIDISQMGVGGLTSFVDDNTHLLSDHRLHNTRVVIDGNNLYHFIYSYYNISFKYGGNLDDFADAVATYFNVSYFLQFPRACS